MKIKHDHTAVNAEQQPSRNPPSTGYGTFGYNDLKQRSMHATTGFDFKIGTRQTKDSESNIISRTRISNADDAKEYPNMQFPSLLFEA